MFAWFGRTSVTLAVASSSIAVAGFSVGVALTGRPDWHPAVADETTCAPISYRMLYDYVVFGKAHEVEVELVNLLLGVGPYPFRPVGWAAVAVGVVWAVFNTVAVGTHPWGRPVMGERSSHPNGHPGRCSMNE